MPQDNSHVDAFSVPTLAELITEQKRQRGFSYRDLEVRADSVITHQRWQQLGSGTRVKEFSEPPTIRAMARALDVDEALVVLAMAKSIGLDVEVGGAQSELARMLPGSTRALTAEQRNAIVGMVRAMTQSPDESQPGRVDVDAGTAPGIEELKVDTRHHKGKKSG